MQPWDTDDIDHWKTVEWKDEYSPGSFLEESSFATLFPQYRERYLRDCWSQVTKALASVHIDCELNLVEGSMTVKTTRKTTDPFILFKARDLIKLLARSVPVDQAVRILQDDVQCDVIKIGNIVRNKERFIKRRARLIGPDGSTLKAIELLTDCYMLVQGNTVSCMGPYAGLKQVRRIVEDCMNNIHPVYNIKTLMIKRELAKDPKLREESWDRFLPQFKKKPAPKKKKPKKTGPKKEKKLFPPAPTMSKVDKQLETGEYFLSKDTKQARAREAKAAARVERSESKREARGEDYVAPSEPRHVPVTPSAASNSSHDISKTVSTLKDKSKKRKRDAELSAFLTPGSRHDGDGENVKKKSKKEKKKEKEKEKKKKKKDKK
eukprot:TRINITY_DN1066_c0_g1_i1.p1 TRINITY_DN1066_c0_g1~~TRINITY_DN1066_c0_g1_i1.p1  ORF type:complete len:378 (+),score=85.87 TRINITY_DN1066_c0_g1_i1:485-1618(+)